MKQQNKSLFGEILLITGPILLALSAVAYFTENSLSGSYSGSNNEVSLASTSIDSKAIDTKVTVGLQAADINLKSATLNLIAENLSSNEIRNVDLSNFITGETSRFQGGVSSENPFKDVLEDTRVVAGGTPDSPALQIERRLAKRQWLDEFELAELKALATKIQRDGEAEGLEIKFNKNFEIVSVRPIPRPNTGLGTLRLTQSGQ